MPGNDMPKSNDRVLRERALRFAGVVLEAPAGVVRPRLEPVSQADAEDALKDRVDRFAMRLNNLR